jgi:hypothetical protein
MLRGPEVSAGGQAAYCLRTVQIRLFYNKRYLFPSPRWLQSDCRREWFGAKATDTKWWLECLDFNSQAQVRSRYILAKTAYVICDNPTNVKYGQ